MEGVRAICFSVQVQALPRETENHYQLEKAQFFIENDETPSTPVHGQLSAVPEPPWQFTLGWQRMEASGRPSALPGAGARRRLSPAWLGKQLEDGARVQGRDGGVLSPGTWPCPEARAGCEGPHAGRCGTFQRSSLLCPHSLQAHLVPLYPSIVVRLRWSLRPRQQPPHFPGRHPWQFRLASLPVTSEIAWAPSPDGPHGARVWHRRWHSAAASPASPRSLGRAAAASRPRTPCLALRGLLGSRPLRGRGLRPRGTGSPRFLSERPGLCRI